MDTYTHTKNQMELDPVELQEFEDHCNETTLIASLRKKGYPPEFYRAYRVPSGQIVIENDFMESRLLHLLRPLNDEQPRIMEVLRALAWAESEDSVERLNWGFPASLVHAKENETEIKVAVYRSKEETWGYLTYDDLDEDANEGDTIVFRTIEEAEDGCAVFRLREKSSEEEATCILVR